MRTIRWGILGSGRIVRRWMRGARQCEGMEVIAIASRSEIHAQQAAEELDIPRVMTVDELVASSDIDVVYIAVPHTAHEELALLAMQHGKAVLCEKPAAVNAASLERMLRCAQKTHTFFMEAVWTRFFPLMAELQHLLRADGIGQPRMVQAAFSSRVEQFPDGSRLIDPALAGGGLLDVGVYPLHFADAVYQEDEQGISGFAAMDTDALHISVDEQAAYLTCYTGGAMAMMACGIRTKIPDTACLYGTRGQIVIPQFWRPTQMTVTIDGNSQRMEFPVPCREGTLPDEGFQYEILHVNDCLRAGLTESPIMTHVSSLRVLRQCDALRHQWGLRYPFESKENL